MITVDIDSKNRANLLATYAKARKFGTTDVTETAQGFHLRIHSRIRNIWKIHRIRRLLGDDPKRLKHDEIVIKMGYPELANRLFERKKRLRDSKWIREKPFDIEKEVRKWAESRQ